MPCGGVAWRGVVYCSAVLFHAVSCRAMPRSVEYAGITYGWCMKYARIMHGLCMDMFLKLSVFKLFLSMICLEILEKHLAHVKKKVNH